METKKNHYQSIQKFSLKLNLTAFILHPFLRNPPKQVVRALLDK